MALAQRSLLRLSAATASLEHVVMRRVGTVAPFHGFSVVLRPLARCAVGGERLFGTHSVASTAASDRVGGAAETLEWVSCVRRSVVSNGHMFRAKAKKKGKGASPSCMSLRLPATRMTF